MKLELKNNMDLEVGDAMVFSNNSVRIIVKTSQGYATYCPEENATFHVCNTITELIKQYSFNRVIKKDNLKLIEI